MGGVLQLAVRMGGEILQGAPVGEDIFGCPPVGMWSEMAFLLEEWALPQDWGEGEVTPEAVVQALHKIGKSLEKQRSCGSGSRGVALSHSVKKEATHEKDVLL